MNYPPPAPGENFTAERRQELVALLQQGLQRLDCGTVPYCGKITYVCHTVKVDVPEEEQENYSLVAYPLKPLIEPRLAPYHGIADWLLAFGDEEAKAVVRGVYTTIEGYQGLQAYRKAWMESMIAELS